MSIIHGPYDSLKKQLVSLTTFPRVSCYLINIAQPMGNIPENFVTHYQDFATNEHTEYILKTTSASLYAGEHIPFQRCHDGGNELNL